MIQWIRIHLPLLGWKWKSLSHVRLCDTLYSPWNSPGQNTGVGSLSLLQGIFPTQGSNPGLPHCRQILYQLSHREAQEYWSGSPSPADLPDPGIEPGGLLHCRRILYQLSYQLSAEPSKGLAHFNLRFQFSHNPKNMSHSLANSNKVNLPIWE